MSLILKMMENTFAWNLIFLSPPKIFVVMYFKNYFNYVTNNEPLTILNKASGLLVLRM